MADKLDRMMALVRQHVPDLRLVHRAEVGWMRGVSSVVRVINPQFDRFTVVLGSTVYLPRPVAEIDRDGLAGTLAHELVHQLDQARWGPLFYASYALALPAGRTWRAHWERRAYAVDLLLARERGGEQAVRRKADWLAGLFAGSGYFFMWTGRQAAATFLQPAVDDVLARRLDDLAPYDAILAAWRGP